MLYEENVCIKTMGMTFAMASHFIKKKMFISVYEYVDFSHVNTMESYNIYVLEVVRPSNKCTRRENVFW